MLNTARAIRLNILGSLATLLLLGGSVVAWAVYAPLDGAVVASALIAIDGSVKKVQHPTGGTVEALYVKEGQKIAGGEPLLRIDDTLVRANLGVILNDHRASQARFARLRAERDGLTVLNFADFGIAAKPDDRDLQDILKSEQTVFQTRVRALTGQKQQLRQRVLQFEQEVKGFGLQLNATAEQLTIGRAELKDLEGLLAQGLAQRTRVTNLQKEVLRNEGTVGDLTAKIAQSQGRISEIELQILQLDQDQMKEVAKDIREVETKLTELQEKRVALDDQLKRSLIRAPESGFVHQLAAHTVGGVVGPGEQIMLIVPTSGDLIVEARVAPQDIDQIKQGQSTRIRFPALNSVLTPEVFGEVFRVGADLTKEPTTGISYYSAGIRLYPQEVAKLTNIKLIPGMPAEAYIKTGERTFAGFLIKPIHDQYQRAMRER